MSKPNCWEFKRCERHPSGKLVGELGVCPASTCNELHGVHEGTNAGRACWVVAGTFCGGIVQGSEAQKQHNCWVCDFFQAVKATENSSPRGFSATKLGMKRALERA